MRAHLLGVRGSTPSPGPDFVRYGGNTSCVAVAGGDRAPTLILDAGTGLRRLPALLAGEPFRGAIVLSHLHWDHVQGLPFCPAIDREDAEVDLHLPVRAGDDPAEVLARAMSPPHFPIPPDGLRGRWRFHAVAEGEHEIGGFAVTVTDVPHKGGRTIGLRLQDAGGSALAYVPDHGPVALGPGARGDGVVHDRILGLVAGADVLLHDAQHTAEEFPARAHFGHTTIDYAIELGRTAGVGRTVLFHHDPNRSDDALDDIAASLPEAVSVAAEGDVVSATARGGPTPTPRAAPVPTPGPGGPRTA